MTPPATPATPNLPVEDDGPLSPTAAAEWEEAGTIDVDAGLLWIGDPCYVREGRRLVNETRPDGEIEEGHPGLFTDWDAFCLAFYGDESASAGRTKSFRHPAGHEGTGIALRPGQGDGSYTVYVRRDPATGQIAELRTIFIEEE